jgi:hypothetical protein
VSDGAVHGFSDKPAGCALAGAELSLAQILFIKGKYALSHVITALFN